MLYNCYTVCLSLHYDSTCITLDNKIWTIGAITCIYTIRTGSCKFNLSTQNFYYCNYVVWRWILRYFDYEI